MIIGVQVADKFAYKIEIGKEKPSPDLFSYTGLSLLLVSLTGAV